VNTETSAGASAHSNNAAAGERSANASDAHAPPKTPAEVFDDLKLRIAEVREYVAYFVAVKADAIKLVVRTTVVYAAMGIIALLAVVAAVVTAVVMLLTGAAQAIGSALGGRMWLGDLIVGAGLLALLAIGVYIGVSSLTRSSRKNTVNKYESRQRAQQSQFGRDVEQRAARGGR